jgi:hypothetical protein
VDMKFVRYCLSGLGVIAFMACAYVLESTLGIPVDTTIDAAIGIACVGLMGMIGWSDYPDQKWPRVAVLIALVINAGLFLFSPLTRHPASEIGIGFFGAPDLVVWLAARTVAYPVSDAHQRAVRQQLIVGLILILPFCAMFLAFGFI